MKNKNLTNNLLRLIVATVTFLALMTTSFAGQAVQCTLPANQLLSHEQYVSAYNYLNTQPDEQLKPKEEVLNTWSINLQRYGLQEDEAQSIFSYTGRLYNVNQALRKPCPPQEALVYAAFMNNGLEKLPRYDGVVRRNFWPFPGWRERYSTGKEVVEPAFTSTTSIPKDGPMVSPSEPIRFIINSKNGRDISMFSYYPHEKEVLFMAGTRFKVLDVKNVDDFQVMGKHLSGTEIQMEEITP